MGAVVWVMGGKQWRTKPRGPVYKDVPFLSSKQGGVDVLKPG